MLMKRENLEFNVGKTKRKNKGFKNGFKQVPLDIFGYYSICDSLSGNKTPTFVFTRCNFDILRFIRELSIWKCFSGKLKYRKKTRDILYQIADTITGNIENPRNIYGTRIQDILTKLEKTTSKQKTLIFAKEIDPEIIPRIAGLGLTVKIIAQPTRGWNEISRLSKKGLCQIITIDSSAQILEQVLRTYVAKRSRGPIFNPWGNITPQALVQVLSEANENLPLFIRMVEQTIQYRLVSAENVNEIIMDAWKVHLEKDIKESEWYILKNLLLYPTKEDLKEVCNEISKTNFEYSFKSLFKRRLIQRSRVYDKKGKKHLYFHLRPVVAEILEASS